MADAEVQARTELEMPRSLAAKLVGLAQEAAPNECVGMLGGIDLLVLGGMRCVVAQLVGPAHNRSPTPEQFFFVDPYDAYRIEEAFFRRGVDVCAIYHSHPTRDAQPSRSDLEFAAGRLMVIIPLSDPKVEAITAWQDGSPVPIRLS